MSASSPDRDATLFQLSGGLSTLTSSVPFLKIGSIYSPSLTHILHPPAPVPPQLVVSSKAGGERAQFLVQVARRLTHSDWGRSSPSAPLLLLTVSLIRCSSLCAILNLGNTKHLKVNGNHFFALVLLQNIGHFRGELCATFQQIRFIIAGVVILTQQPEKPAALEWKVLHHNCFGCKLYSFLRATFSSGTFLRFLPLRGVAFIWNFDHFSALLLTLAISGAVLSPCYSGRLVAPLSGQFYFPLTFHPRIRRAFVGCWGCLCLPRLKLCTLRSPVGSDPDWMWAYRVHAVNLNVATVCENALCGFLHLSLLHRRTFVYVDTTRFAY